MFALCFALVLLAALAVYAIHKTKASRVKVTVEIFKLVRFNFLTDSPPRPEDPDPADEP